MSTNQMRAIKHETNIEASGWKSAEHRKMMVKKILEFLIKHGPPSWAQNLSDLVKSVEKFEEKVNASSKDEAEYMARISMKLKSLIPPPQNSASKPKPSVSSGSEPERAANIEWQEQVYHKVQMMKNTYFTKLNTIYQQMSGRLKQHESIPQQSKTTDMEKCKYHKKALEYIFALFKVTKSQITPSFKERLDKVEKYIHSIVQPKYVPSHHQAQHSADVHSMQPFVPPHSRISQVEISEKKPTSQEMSLQSSHLTKQIPQQNKMDLQEHQVATQFSSPQQNPNEVSIVKGVGNAVQQQTSGATKPAEVFVVSTPGLSASPFLEDCANQNEISHNPTVISDDASPAMQRLVKALTSMTPEALSASVHDIGAVVNFNDGTSTLEPLDGPLCPNLEEVIVTDSQTRYTCNDLVPRGRKMSRCISSMATSESLKQLNGAEKPYSNSVTSQVKQPRIVENRTLLEEIKEIDKLLIDTEVVISEEDTIPSAAEGAAEHSEGLIVKLFFSAVTVNLNLMSQYTYDKRSLIKPLRLLVPTSYPLCSPVILDDMPLEVSPDRENLDDLSTKAKFKLRFSLQSLNQPWSLVDMAMLWEHCAREAILEYAQQNGGGTFTSKYGAWEDMCLYAG